MVVYENKRKSSLNLNNICYIPNFFLHDEVIFLDVDAVLLFPQMAKIGQYGVEYSCC
jgi:hypothetical protein